jgi:hypothetical protein
MAMKTYVSLHITQTYNFKLDLFNLYSLNLGKLPLIPVFEQAVVHKGMLIQASIRMTMLKVPLHNP